MGLRIKQGLRQLSVDPLEIVWPGDDAVDLGASKLDVWCREGGQAGLVMKPGRSPDIITCRRLSDPALSIVMPALAHRTAGYSLAFRLGIVKFPGVPVIPESVAGIRAMAQYQADAICELDEARLELPWLEAEVAVLEARGQGKREDFIEGEVASEEIALPIALGCLILAESFRKRRVHA